LARVFSLLRQPDSIVDSAGLRQLIDVHLTYALSEDAAIPVRVTANSLEGLQFVSQRTGERLDAPRKSQRE
jgi:hypothetical protein